MFSYSGKIKFLRSALIFLLLLTPALIQANQARQEHELPRKVLALFKGSEKRTVENNEIYALAQLILNNLGLVVEYRDAEKPLPSPAEMGAYRGVITWFVSEKMKGARRYRTWLGRVLDSGKKVVILGNFGALTEIGRNPDQSDCNEACQLLGRFGIKSKHVIYPAQNLSIAFKDPEFFDFERVLNPEEIPLIFAVRSVSPRNRVLLQLRQGNIISDAAILSPQGGVVLPGVIFYQDTFTGLDQWYLNPEKFFTAALDLEAFPQADINTINGRRTAFIHIDGDGFSTISKIDYWHLCGDLFYSRIANKFDLPFSVSVIAAEIDSAYMGSDETIDVARKIFALPNVEAASHGFAHPFDWRTGKLELDSIPDYQFDPKQEILGSVAYIRSQLVPAYKDVRLFFWSGMCNPTAEHIRLAEKNGLLQLNGDAGRIYDNLHSVTNFAPPYAQIDGAYRNNARISNEYEFTNRWLGPYDGYKEVISSLEFTQRRRPFVPADIYFHFYSLEWKESWSALRTVLKWAEHQPWTFVYASQYVRMVSDFLTARIYRLDDSSFLVKNSGALRTIRFPREKRIPDLLNSRDVIGYSHVGEDLYVYLNSVGEHIIRLQDAGSQPAFPYIRTANVWVDSVKFRADTLKIFAMGYGPFRFSLQGMRKNQTYRVTFRSLPQIMPIRRAVTREAFVRLQPNPELAVRSNEAGQLHFEGKGQNYTVIEIVAISPFVFYFAKVKYFLFLIIIIFLAFVFLSWTGKQYEGSRQTRDLPGLKEEISNNGAKQKTLTGAEK